MLASTAAIIFGFGGTSLWKKQLETIDGVSHNHI